MLSVKVPSAAQAHLWEGLRAVIDGPLSEIAINFSRFISPIWPHDALVIFTRECTGRPRKVAGESDIVDKITINELRTLVESIGLPGFFEGVGVVGGVRRQIWAARDSSDTLLLVVPKSTRRDAPEADLVIAWFGIVATSIGHQVTQASPSYLAESRAASSERARTRTELTELHDATLVSILAMLRSKDLDDRHSRIAAGEKASAALIALRSAASEDQALAEEPVSAAFARLKDELCPLLRHGNVDVDYAEPPPDGRPLPGEVAHAARALARTIVLAFQAQTAMGRLRLAWGCDGTNLLMEVRDQGEGSLDRDDLARHLAGRLRTLCGHVDIETLTGWGSRVSVTIPLGPPATRPDEHLLSKLNPRELEVLVHLARGKRNKTIAAELGISESTIKFHVASVLQKLAVTNRGEAGAIAIRAGVVSF